MAETRSPLSDWKCRRGLLIRWWHARPLKRRCHLQSHREWHLQMTVWHLDPVHLKNKSDSFMSPPPKPLSCSASRGWSWERCGFGLLYRFTPVTVALPGEIVGALRSSLRLARLSHYLTFPLTWSPAVFQLGVVLWQHRLSAGALEWHFTLSPPWTCAPTLSPLFYFHLLFQEVCSSERGCWVVVFSPTTCSDRDFNAKNIKENWFS